MITVRGGFKWIEDYSFSQRLSDHLIEQIDLIRRSERRVTIIDANRAERSGYIVQNDIYDHDLSLKYTKTSQSHEGISYSTIAMIISSRGSGPIYYIGLLPRPNILRLGSRKQIDHALGFYPIWMPDALVYEFHRARLENRCVHIDQLDGRDRHIVNSGLVHMTSEEDTAHESRSLEDIGIPGNFNIHLYYRASTPVSEKVILYDGPWSEDGTAESIMFDIKTSEGQENYRETVELALKMAIETLLKAITEKQSTTYPTSSFPEERIERREFVHQINYPAQQSDLKIVIVEGEYTLQDTNTGNAEDMTIRRLARHVAYVPQLICRLMEGFRVATQWFRQRREEHLRRTEDIFLANAEDVRHIYGCAERPIRLPETAETETNEVKRVLEV